MKSSITRTVPLVILATLVLQLNPVLSLVPDLEKGRVHTISNVSISGSRTAKPQYVELTDAEPAERFDSIVFVGDVLLARNVEHLMDRYGTEYPFSAVDLLAIANRPAVVANFESSIPEQHIPTPPYNLVFSTKTEHAQALVDEGFTFLSVANNHSLDYGLSGKANTIETLTAAGANVFGQSHLLDYDSVQIVTTTYGKVALIGLDDTQRTVQLDNLRAILKRAEQISDFQVIYIHWGLEYDSTSSPRQRQLAEQLVSAGADLIVGHHPHVVQEVAMIESVPVFYSLGNYIFDQYFSRDVQQGLLLSFEFKPEPRIVLHPVESMTSLSQPRLATRDSKAVALYELSKKTNSSELAAAIRRGVITVPLDFASTPKVAMMTE